MHETLSGEQKTLDGLNVEQDLPPFLKDLLLLDLEAKNNRIYAIGAVLGDKVFQRPGKFELGEALADLDGFAEEAQGILGHNLLDHDLPLLRNLRPDLALLNKPVIDTLFLSPLAFPENPYHRLVKDYKLVKDSVSDPVADARLAASVFVDQWQSFTRMAAGGQRDILSFYRFCFELHDESQGIPYQGIAAVFAALGAPVGQRRPGSRHR